MLAYHRVEHRVPESRRPRNLPLNIVIVRSRELLPKVLDLVRKRERTLPRRPRERRWEPPAAPHLGVVAAARSPGRRVAPAFRTAHRLAVAHDDWCLINHPARTATTAPLKSCSADGGAQSASAARGTPRPPDRRPPLPVSLDPDVYRPFLNWCLRLSMSRPHITKACDAVCL